MEIGAGAPDDDGTVVIRVSDRLRGWRMNFQPRNVVHGERGVAFMCRNIFSWCTRLMTAVRKYSRGSRRHGVRYDSMVEFNHK